MEQTYDSRRSYQLTTPRRVANWLISGLLRLGVPMGRTYLLTVPGRRTGEPRTTPVNVLPRDGRRYLVAPYGEVGWVRNAIAAGEVTLGRGGWRTTHQIIEVDMTESQPVLKQYLMETPIVRPFFAVSPDDPVEAFSTEAERCPVFRLG